MKVLSIGDLFKIQTGKGVAYFQFIYDHSNFAQLIRILPGLYTTEPDLENLAKGTEQFKVFFPLKLAAKKRKLVEKVGSADASGFYQPEFMRINHIREGVKEWHIVNTESLQIQRVKSLTKEQKKLSPWGIWNDIMLIESLEEDFSLETWT